MYTSHHVSKRIHILLLHISAQNVTSSYSLKRSGQTLISAVQEKKYDSQKNEPKYEWKMQMDQALKRSVLHRQTMKIALPIAFNGLIERVITRINNESENPIPCRLPLHGIDSSQYSPVTAKRYISGVDVSVLAVQ